MVDTDSGGHKGLLFSLFFSPFPNERKDCVFEAWEKEKLILEGFFF